MNEQPPPHLPQTALADSSELPIQVKHLARGVRAVALVFTLFTCFINFSISTTIGKFKEIFADMLPDQSLPPLTAFVINAQGMMVLVALLLPLSALVSVFAVKRHDHALYTLAGIMGLSLFLAMMTWTSLFLPVLAIIQQLGGGY